MKNKLLLFAIIIFNNLLFAQKSFHKDVNLPEQNKYNDGSKGTKINYLNGYLYSICWSFSSNSASGYSTEYFHFIKYNSEGDSVFTKKIYTDSINSIAGISELSILKNRNGFHFSFTNSKKSFYSPQLTNHLIYLDTLGNILDYKKISMANDSSKLVSGITNIVLDDSLYSIFYQTNKGIDTSTSYLINWNGNNIKDTLIEFKDSVINHRLTNLIKLKNNTYIILETQKNPGFILPYKGKSFLRFYDSNFNLIKAKQITGYWRTFDIKLLNDTIVILGSNFYSVQFNNNYIFYTLKKISLTGDSLYDWTSKTMRYDTVSDRHTLLILKNQFYIGSDKFLYKVQNDSLHIVRDMRKFLPSEYCYINDSAIGFTGEGYKKLSNIGIITPEGKFSDFKNKLELFGQIVIYPNPSNNGVLNVKGINDGSYRVSIINYLGQEVLSRIENTNQIETRLNAGLYVVRISIKSTTHSFKWLVQY